jgi:hypothetical protein
MNSTVGTRENEYGEIYTCKVFNGLYYLKEEKQGDDYSDDRTGII